jgi:hypothetical protein
MIDVTPHRGSARPTLIGRLRKASGTATVALGFGLALREAARHPATSPRCRLNRPGTVAPPSLATRAEAPNARYQDRSERRFSTKVAADPTRQDLAKSGMSAHEHLI